MTNPGKYEECSGTCPECGNGLVRDKTTDRVLCTECDYSNSLARHENERRANFDGEDGFDLEDALR